MDIITPPKTNPLNATAPLTNSTNLDPSNNLENLKLHPLFQGAFRDVSNEDLEPLTLSRPALNYDDVFGVNTQYFISLESKSDQLSNDASNPFLQFFSNSRTTLSNLSEVDALTGFPSSSFQVGQTSNLLFHNNRDDELLEDNTNPGKTFIQLERNPQKVDPDDGTVWAFVGGFFEGIPIGGRALVNTVPKVLSFGFYEGNILGEPTNPEERRLHRIALIPARIGGEAGFAALTLGGNLYLKGAQGTTTGVKVLRGLNTAVQIGEGAQAIRDTGQGVIAIHDGNTGEGAFLITTGLIGQVGSFQGLREIPLTSGSKTIDAIENVGGIGNSTNKLIHILPESGLVKGADGAIGLADEHIIREINDLHPAQLEDFVTLMQEHRTLIFFESSVPLVHKGSFFIRHAGIVEDGGLQRSIKNAMKFFNETPSRGPSNFDEILEGGWNLIFMQKGDKLGTLLEEGQHAIDWVKYPIQMEFLKRGGKGIDNALFHVGTFTRMAENTAFPLTIAERQRLLDKAVPRLMQNSMENTLRFPNLSTGGN